MEGAESGYFDAALGCVIATLLAPILVVFIVALAPVALFVFIVKGGAS